MLDATVGAAKVGVVPEHGPTTPMYPTLWKLHYCYGGLFTNFGGVKTHCPLTLLYIIPLASFPLFKSLRKSIFRNKSEMVHTKALTVAAAALLLAVPAAADGIYSKSSPVLQVDAKSYDRLIAKSNYTSIVEFYAPWCGHCKNLKPAYEKVAQKLAGFAKVAAVNCDDESNKGFCGSMGVQGFPTLKIVRPGKKPGRPTVEDYQGERSTKAIADAVADKMPNHVVRLKDGKVGEWLAQENEAPKALLFTSKGTTSALIKALAIEFLGSISFAQIRDKEAEAVKTFSITEFPTLVLLPGGDKESLIYSGELKKDPIVAFLSQVAAPNPDPPAPSPRKPKKEQKAEPKEAKGTKKQQDTTDSTESAESAEPEVTIDTEVPSPEEPIQVPIAKPLAPPIPTISSTNDLKESCLLPKSKTCILALLPSSEESSSLVFEALASLADIALKHEQRKGHLFPFFATPMDNEVNAHLRKSLGLSSAEGKIELVAVNARRGWWRHFNDKAGFGVKEVEDWIDAIRLDGRGGEKLPDGVVEAVVEEDVHDEL
ncbi:hypothetical protein FGG08_004353 [Glutinoglossum americanum]|uniref:protein disulfide-isomerase n=1 Tax=Glutinoglossum americanum TaxID=1670608 RepID=A0A9P8KX73_9PEZI|nr:hypothetical protein FGG08_004353 [Glutinoglossum americanum]